MAWPDLLMMDSEMDNDKSCLKPPPVTSVKYQRNFIKNAVCELRFPTLLELETKAPTNFQAKIRKIYPFFEKQVIEQIATPEGTTYENRYLFRSKDKEWTVSINSSAISIETSNYSEFDEFFSRLCHILECARELIDSDFFTRIGLRYINAIPINDESPEGWINSDLILPITCGVLGNIKSSATIIRGCLDTGGEYSFQHGLKRSGESDNKNYKLTYALDFDYYKENVELDDVRPLVTYFNETNFAFFSWCLGNKARQILGEGKLK